MAPPKKKREAQQIVKGTTMASENVVLSANQSDVEPCFTAHAAYEAAISARAAAESASSRMSPPAVRRGVKAIKREGLIDCFEDIIGARGTLRQESPLDPTLPPTP